VTPLARLVESNSIISPRYMKAVKSETRAASCMLWVTIAIVQSTFRFSINCWIFAFEIGSSAEPGSSNRMTSGRTAKVRAMQSCGQGQARPAAGL
jgi:hypothetical protein